jgi:hypothetical protein
VSLFDSALRVAITSIHGAQGSPSISYTPYGGAAFTVVAVFSADGVRVDLSSGVVQESTAPRLGVRLADFATPPAHGDEWVVGGKTYRVVGVTPDGEGGAELTGAEL